MTQLRVPGPTPCPPEVLKAMAWQMVNHRGPEYHEMITEVTENLKKVFQTKNDVLLLTGSGTGGLEAAVVNTLSPGDKVLSVTYRRFRRPLCQHRQDLRRGCRFPQGGMGQSRRPGRY